MWIRQTLRFLERLIKIKLIILRLLFAWRLGRPVRFRMFFEQAGGAFLKLGQILSLRHDFIPPVYANELLNLLSRVESLPWPALREVFIAEIGAPPEKVFQQFNNQPIASASISQVYRAKLPTGELVAVKIQRPGIREVFETDFILASFLGGLLSIFRFFDSFQIQDIVSEFISATRRELDFREELNNSLALLAHSSDHPRTIIPKCYSELSTERVLVSEYMTEILSVETVLERLAANPDYAAELKERQRINLEDLAYYFVFDIMRQYFIDGFFHADPHPANLFFAPGNRLGYFDFGIIGRAGKNRLDLLRIIYGIAKRDLNFSSRHFLRFAKSAIAKEMELFKQKDRATYDRYVKVLEKLEEIMTDNLQADLEKILAPWYQEQSSRSYHHLTSSIVISKMILRARDYSIYLPREIIMFFRALIISDMVALRLAPNFDIMKALNRFFDRYPLGVAEELITARTHEAKLEETVDASAHLSFDELLALKEAEQEELSLAKERLINLIAAYAEDYQEVRQLLKT
ncbi:MAG: AarF/ABC1/UbiB kinase family protein [Candidatus Vogelbacteria bacterium]|nr:AarF/ABC1/UbiB kinase family protein [Candidatus Vogelbacteria bacterium]